MLYYRQGRYAEAAPLDERALEIAEANLGSEHPDPSEEPPEPGPVVVLEIRQAAPGADNPDVTFPSRSDRSALPSPAAAPARTAG